MDELVPIPRENWADLRDLFRTNWPAHELPHNVVQNYIDWIQIDAKIANLQVFSLNGGWRSEGTFIIIVSEFIGLIDQSLTSLLAGSLRAVLLHARRVKRQLATSP